MKTWFYTVETDCKDPEKLNEFRDWYDQIHIPDIFSTKAFVRASRYELVSANIPSGGFLVTYELHADDLKQVFKTHWENMKQREVQGRISPLVTPISRRIYEEPITFVNGNHSEDHTGLERYIYMVEVACKDKRRSREFEEWYQTIHIPDLLETPAFASAVRYRTVDPAPGEGDYLTVYEIWSNNLDQTLDEIKESMAVKRSQGRFSDLLVSVSRRFYREVSVFRPDSQS